MTIMGVAGKMAISIHSSSDSDIETESCKPYYHPSSAALLTPMPTPTKPLDGTTMEVGGAGGRGQGQGAADTLMVVQGTVCQQLLPAGGLKKLSIVGRALRKCVSLDPCLFVVSHALDSMFDVFGDDDCPAVVFWELEMLPVLEELASKFSSRVRRKGRGGETGEGGREGGREGGKGERGEGM